jgi:hypothetical protein
MADINLRDFAVLAATPVAPEEARQHAHVLGKKLPPFTPEARERIRKERDASRVILTRRAE